VRSILVVTEKLTAKFGGSVEVTEGALDWPTLRVRAADIARVCEFAKSDLDMNYLPNLTAVDWEDRFEMVYHLYSTRTRDKLMLKVDLPHDDPHIATVTHVWRAANWFEREVYDMFGIRFDGHPDLRRILMPDEVSCHPLRKDFDFIDDPDDPIALEPRAQAADRRQQTTDPD
jgi:NADH-quinone oxidoreductase subunit C